MNGVYRAGDFLYRGEPGLITEKRKPAPFCDQVHGFVFVVKANDPCLENINTARNYREITKKIKGIYLDPVTIITHQGNLNQDEYDGILKHVSEVTGTSLEHTFLLAIYCPEKPGPDENTEQQVFKIIKCILHTAEEYVMITKQLKRNKQKIEVGRVIEEIYEDKPARKIDNDVSMDIFLKEVQKYHPEWNEELIEEVLEELRDQDIKSLDIFCSSWKDLQAIFKKGNPLRNQMRIVIKNLLVRMGMIKI